MCIKSRNNTPGTRYYSPRSQPWRLQLVAPNPPRSSIFGIALLGCPLLCSRQSTQRDVEKNDGKLKQVTHKIYQQRKGGGRERAGHSFELILQSSCVTTESPANQNNGGVKATHCCSRASRKHARNCKHFSIAGRFLGTHFSLVVFLRRNFLASVAIYLKLHAG